MPAKKKTAAKKTPAPRATGTDTAVTHQHLAAITHVARMNAVLEATPDHARGVEYADAIAEYQRLWRGLSPEAKGAVVLAASEIHDMTDERIAAAVTTLEG